MRVSDTPATADVKARAMTRLTRRPSEIGAAPFEKARLDRGRTPTHWLFVGSRRFAISVEMRFRLVHAIGPTAPIRED
jgi:hypothetical protein